MKTYALSLKIFLILLLGTIAGTATAANPSMAGGVKVTREPRVVSSFDAISVSGAFEVFLKQGEPNEVVIEADEDIQKAIKVEVKGSTLIIGTNKPIHHPTTMKVYITFKNIKSLETSGAVDVTTEQKVTLDELQLETSGASDMKMDLAVRKLALNSSGASKMRLSGAAADVDADLSGACDIYGFDLICENFSVEMSGAGKAQITVNKKISAEISGAGTIHYKGKPEVVNQSVSGAGTIKRVE